MPSFEVGESIPPNTAHAVSVSLPTWKSNIAYEEGEDWVVSRMAAGYPRFFIHKSIKQLESLIVEKHATANQSAMLFPCSNAARRCQDFILAPNAGANVRVLDFRLHQEKNTSALLSRLMPTLSAVLFPTDLFPLAKQYWQHTGDGISSRHAEFCTELLSNDLLTCAQQKQQSTDTAVKPFRGPRRYQTESTTTVPSPPKSKPSPPPESQESTQFLEERFGRNLNVTLVGQAKTAICRRIVGSITDPTPQEDGTTSPCTACDNVYLFSGGMNAIFHTHRALLDCRGAKKSVSFGFPYVDTLKVLQKFGPGCFFFGFASDSDLDKLEALLRGGEKILALFCEFPGNPLLVSPNLRKIRALADEFDFAVVVDETIGTFANVDVLQFSDVVVSSLTKIFSGESNVMGGCAILNPKSRYFEALKASYGRVYEDTYWAEDIIFMERNSRDYRDRVDRVNANAELICSVLQGNKHVKDLFYPKFSASKANYDACRRPNGGYGGLLSVVFENAQQAEKFYDSMAIAKGPSLGTNFTLCSPYAILAHYTELGWAAEYGVDANLVRISVGLEDKDELRETFQSALNAIDSSS
ncbi:hypothetical protein VHEMI09025 [[Torrubiella] hemipterigena]|uniref:Cystathionine gamma-synthase n=1 Tax=[Torrubiella] hemipterigena TaxID=1531966 RepID=A0A0A1TP93_9HYPO|nr:hypothetical protein VHEMI09025 [[Torrubiella] hemipterigena]